jgi:MarR family transcriptional regulator, organic hydroperoxide resistance regulator
METDIGFLVFQIKQYSDRLFNRLLAEKGLASYNGAQGRILISLWNDGAGSIHDLSKRTSLAPTTLTTMLDRLEEKGLIARKKSAKDRRVIWIEATKKSLTLKADYLAIDAEVNQRFLKDFTPNDITDLRKQLNHLKDNIHDKGE